MDSVHYVSATALKDLRNQKRTRTYLHISQVILVRVVKRLSTELVSSLILPDADIAVDDSQQEGNHRCDGCDQEAWGIGWG